MLIHKIQNRLNEELYIQKYIEKLNKLLARIEQQMNNAFVKAQQDGVWSPSELAKYNRDAKLKRAVREEIAQFTKEVKNDLRDDLAALYKQEALYTQNLLKQVTQLGITVEFDSLPTTAIKSQVVDLVTIKGKTLTEYVSKYGQDIAFRIEQEIWESIALGENPRKTAKRLADLNLYMQNRVEMTVRSWHLAIQNQANLMVYEQAGIEKVRYLATLDSRTCAVCAADHNKVMTNDSIIPLPRHPNCRCTYAPEIKGLTSEARGYDEWLLDPSRTEEELRQVKDTIELFMRKRKISKTEGKYLLSLIRR